MADEQLIYYDSETGLHRASEDTIKNSLKAVITDAYGDVFLDDNYPDGIVINGLTKMISNTFDTVETIYNMLDITNAEGVVLDTIANIRNEHRKVATNSYLYVSITVPETVTFINGTLTLKDESNNYWILSQVDDQGVATDLTITVTPPAVSASKIGRFISTSTGVMQMPNILTIASMDASIPILPENISLTISDFISGKNEETDIEFRNRINEYPVFNSVTLKENLSSHLRDLNYIEDVKVYYNNSTLNLIPKGHTQADTDYLIPPAKMEVMLKLSDTVNLDTDANKLQEIYNVIADYKGLGTICWLPNVFDVEVTINDSTFSTAVGDVEGTYEFEYDGTNWNLNGSSVTLNTYGITLTGTPQDNDRLVVNLTIEEGTPSTTHKYNYYVGNPYISTSGDPEIADGISQFMIPGTQRIVDDSNPSDVYGIKLTYIKTGNFDSTPITITDPDSEPTSVYNIKNLIQIYIQNKNIGDNLTVGDLINYLYNNTNEIYAVNLVIAGAVNGVLVNNDKILDIDIENIILTEQS